MEILATRAPTQVAVKKTLAAASRRGGWGRVSLFSLSLSLRAAVAVRKRERKGGGEREGEVGRERCPRPGARRSSWARAGRVAFARRQKKTWPSWRRLGPLFTPWPAGAVSFTQSNSATARRAARVFPKTPLWRDEKREPKGRHRTTLLARGPIRPPGVKECRQKESVWNEKSVWNAAT